MEWISVNDKLPEKIGDYYVWPDSARKPRRFNGKNFVGGDYSGSWEIFPTHWRPLPEPPKQLKRKDEL